MDSMEHPSTVIDALRRQLIARRHDIIGRVARTQHVLGELDESQPAEIEEEAQELNQVRLFTQLSERGRSEIHAIDDAITRMESGDYGVCETCEEPIDVARLEVLPTARLCTTCAEASERRAHQRAQLESTESVDDDG